MPATSMEQKGFTLIEIIIVLIITGILAGMGTAKYFDLQEQSERKAALTSVAEAQSRLNLRFSDLLLQGNSCSKIVDDLSDLSSVADSTDPKGLAFGDFYLTPVTITTSGTDISARRISTGGQSFETGAKLYLPDCDGIASMNLGNSTVMNKISSSMLIGIAAGTQKRVHLDSGALLNLNTGTDIAINDLVKNSGIDLSQLAATSWAWINENRNHNSTFGSFYWTNIDIQNMNSNSQTTVIGYNSRTGQYSVYTATITKAKLDDTHSYNIISAASEITNAGTDGTYESALKFYKENVK